MRNSGVLYSPGGAHRTDVVRFVHIKEHASNVTISARTVPGLEQWLYLPNVSILLWIGKKNCLVSIFVVMNLSTTATGTIAKNVQLGLQLNSFNGVSHSLV